MSSLAQKRPRPLMFISRTLREDQWKNMWDKYVPLLLPFYEINKLETKSNFVCTNIMIDDPKYSAKGASKFIQKCNFVDDSHQYATTLNVNILDEIENHLDILYLYYSTLNDYNWKFTIPKVYKSKTVGHYIMDFISIDPTTWKNAKKIYTFPPELQENIGQFMGLYTLNYGKRLLEFETYNTLDEKGTASIPAILDFGNYIKFDLKEMKNIPENTNFTYYSVPEHMYNGLISIFNTTEVETMYGKDFWKKIAQIKDPVLFGGQNTNDILKKYYKYKHKYLNLKKIK